MITFSGRHITPATIYSAPCPSLRDFAVQSARMCRYAGAIWWPVLTHQVLTAEIIAHWNAHREAADWLPTWAWALCHDLHECITGEVVFDFKPRALKDWQRQIDTIKIMPFMNLDRADIDREQIGRADGAARDAEALACGLPNFGAVVEKTEGRTLALDPWILKMAEALRDSPWADGDMVYASRRSTVVGSFECTLDYIQHGQLPQATDYLHAKLPPAFLAPTEAQNGS